jgi:RNA-directed DNA polymerase
VRSEVASGIAQAIPLIWDIPTSECRSGNGSVLSHWAKDSNKPSAVRKNLWNEGFDFLGWNFRKYRNGKLIIKPDRKSVKKFKAGIKQVIQQLRTATQEDLIRAINPRITGWSNYRMSVNAKQTYSKIDGYINWKLWKWAKRRHPEKDKDWIRKRYWTSTGNRNYEFASDNVILKRCSNTPIVRHSRAKLNANPYTESDYFENKAKWRRKRKCAAYSQTTAAQLDKLRY